MKNNPTKGYIVVASNKFNFYQSAIFLIQTIKDYHPEANVTLFTEQGFLDGRESIADNVVICGNWKREKLLAMWKTPYDITFYLDADMQCLHEDIANVFDELGDYDMMFTGLPEHRSYLFNGWEFEQGNAHFELCGGVCLYDIRKPLVREFLEEWDELYRQQVKGTWWPLNEEGEHDYYNYPESFKAWDQFPLWWMTTKSEKYKDLKVGIFEDDLRWNHWAHLWDIEFPKNPSVLIHMSAAMKKNSHLVNRLYVDD